MGYAFVYDEGIMLRQGIVTIVEDTVTLLAALALIGAAFAGYLRTRLTTAARLMALAAGLGIAFGHIVSDHTRLVASLLVLALFWFVPGPFAAQEARDA